MSKEFIEATRPVVTEEAAVKEGNFFTRFLWKNPRLIFPLTGGIYFLWWGMLITLLIFINQ